VNWRGEVIDAIACGIRGACSDIPTFTENWSGTLAAEYLLTVRVAEAIRDLNDRHGGIGFPFKVYIAERTPGFIRKFIPLWPILKHIGPRKRIYRAVKRKGKVDIAVTHDSAPSPVGPAPVCAIEIKGFDPKRKEVHKDVIRNANFMKVAELTSRREMFTVFAALHLGKAAHEIHKDSDIKKIRKKYEQLFREIRSRAKGLKIDFGIFTAGEHLAGDGMSAVELDDLEESWHHFVAAIVTFYWETTVP
jgi:hypothetical protein